MPTKRRGFIDSYHTSRLAHVTGTNYPATLAGTYLALYGGSLPASDGTGGNEITGTRPSITFGSTQTDANGRLYVTNTGAVSVTLTNATAAQVVGFGVCGASTGGTPVYFDTLDPFQVAAGASITIPAGAIRMYAEPPTI